eukprot:1140502-Pelagomonas_calceolata.AAC.3
MSITTGLVSMEVVSNQVLSTHVGTAKYLPSGAPDHCKAALLVGRLMAQAMNNGTLFFLPRVESFPGLA